MHCITLITQICTPVRSWRQAKTPNQYAEETNWSAKAVNPTRVGRVGRVEHSYMTRRPCGAGGFPHAHRADGLPAREGEVVKGRLWQVACLGRKITTHDKKSPVPGKHLPSDIAKGTTPLF